MITMQDYLQISAEISISDALKDIFIKRIYYFISKQDLIYYR
jgi:hypothetical protein